MTVVLLTGATRGIGQAAAIELARRGAEVALVGRTPSACGRSRRRPRRSGAARRSMSMSPT